MIDNSRYSIQEVPNLSLPLRWCTCNSEQTPPDGGDVLLFSSPRYGNINIFFVPWFKTISLFTLMNVGLWFPFILRQLGFRCPVLANSIRSINLGKSPCLCHMHPVSPCPTQPPFPSFFMYFPQPAWFLKIIALRIPC